MWEDSKKGNSAELSYNLRICLFCKRTLRRLAMVNNNSCNSEPFSYRIIHSKHSMINCTKAWSCNNYYWQTKISCKIKHCIIFLYWDKQSADSFNKNSIIFFREFRECLFYLINFHRNALNLRSRKGGKGIFKSDWSHQIYGIVHACYFF